MVLLIASKEDISICKIIDWLKFYNKPYLLLNEINVIKNIKVTICNSNTDILLETNFNFKFRLKEVKSFYYRNGELYSLFRNENKNILIKKHLKDEWIKLKDFIISYLETKNRLGDYFHSNVNKLIVLTKAIDCGFLIPFTQIANNKKDVIFDNNKIITKPISEVFNIVKQKSACKLRTNLIDKEKMPLSFFPSLFQQAICKKYELRVFVINKKIFTMAIMSQKNIKSKYDYRNYPIDIPNKYIPYKLEKIVELKILKLIKKLCLTTGSIDLIRDTNNKIYFLEINPIGQYGIVSQSCNYNLEKHIAKLL